MANLLSSRRDAWRSLLWIYRTIMALAYTLLALILPLPAPRELWGLHPAKNFEGFYTRTQNDQGDTIVVIFGRVCSSGNPYILHLSYTPGYAKESGLYFSKDWYPESLEQSPVHERDEVDIRIDDKENGISLELNITKRTSWNKKDHRQSPEGAFAHLHHLLSQHWYVHSTWSVAEYSLRHPVVGELNDVAVAHLEKNYGSSFPSGWVWAQAFSNEPQQEQMKDGTLRTPRFTMAGGHVFRGVQAYLVGFRGRIVDWSWKPPGTAILFGKVNLGVKVLIRPEEGKLHMVFTDLTRKLEVTINAPTESFRPFTCPFSSGFVVDSSYESFKAHVSVRASERRFVGCRWKIVDEAELSGAALEFGGSCWKESEAGNV